MSYSAKWDKKEREAETRWIELVEAQYQKLLEHSIPHNPLECELCWTLIDTKKILEDMLTKAKELKRKI